MDKYPKKIGIAELTPNQIAELDQKITLMIDKTGRIKMTKIVGDVGVIVGNVTAGVIGNITQSITGTVYGNIEGDLIGNICGDLDGHVKGGMSGVVCEKQMR